MKLLPSTQRPLSRAVCALALAGAAACDHRSPLPHDPAAEARLQQVLDDAVATPGVLLPGAIAHWRSPAHARWTGSAGLGDLDARTPIRPASRIRAGSVLKTFVAAVALQHVEEGTLSLEATLPELLPASVTDRFASADRITLRMLLDHTSGIPEWVTDEVHARVASDPAHVWTDDEALDLAAGQPPAFEPGTAWGYSNTNYTLAGLVLERAGGTSWREQIRARVLAPLELGATLLPEPGDRTITAEYARGYHDAGGAAVDLSLVDPSMAGAAGGNALVSTVQDLATFLDALLAGRLFARPETLAEMIAMVEAPNGTGLPHWYGLGVEAYEFPGRPPIVGNAGAGAGYTVMMFRVPAAGATLVTAVNASDLSANAFHVLLPSLDAVAAPAP